MSYSALREQEGVRQEFLVVMSPRRRVQTWTLSSGFIYTADWTLAKPRSLEFNGVAMTEVGTSAVGASEWYYDEANQRIYLREPESGDPDAGIVVVSYELYSARRDQTWFRVPTDNTTETVFFQGTTKSNPEIRFTMSDSLFGYLPTLSSSIKLLNSEHWLEGHVYSSSFNRAPIKIYHALGDSLSVANIKKIYDGLMSDVDYSGDEVAIKTIDRIDLLTSEFRQTGSSFFNLNDFSALDPNYSGKPIRYVYGQVKGFVPVNVDFVQDSPTTSDNRDFVVCGGQTGLSEVVRTVGGGTHTTTRTYVDFTEGLNIGDTVKLDRVSGTDVYVEITAVSRSPAYIEHAAIISAMANGDSVKRGFVSRVEIEQQGVRYLALYGRDYTCSNAMSGGTSGFSFSTSLESNLSMPETLSTSDQVFCTVYGRVNDLTAGGPTFGANDSETNNLANPVMVIYDLLKSRLGISESEIDLTGFAALRTTTASEGLGFAIPKSASGSFPTMKDLFADILQGSLFRLTIDDDSKWALSQLGPAGSADFSVDSTELIGDLKHSFNYSDVISEAVVEYASREIPDSIGQNSPQVSRVSAESSVAKNLHKVNKTQTVESFHMRETDAQTLANRMIYALGDRRGIATVSTPIRLLRSEIGDKIELRRVALPGFSYDRDTERSRTGVLVEVAKDSSKITLQIDDQKGIEDNSGSW